MIVSSEMIDILPIMPLLIVSIFPYALSVSMSMLASFRIPMVFLVDVSEEFGV